MNEMDFVQWSAYIGCATGLASLIITLRQIWLERFKLKIEFHENENLYFDKLESYKTYRTNLQGVLRVRFINRSALPLTIYSMTVYIDGQGANVETFKDDAIKLCTYINPDGDTELIEIPMDTQVTLPLRLDVYDVFEGFIFLPFYPDTDKASQLVKLTVKTSKGTRSKHSRIWIKTTVIDDGDGPYYQ